MNLLKAVSVVRAEKGVSISSIAKTLNVSRKTIYKTLSGKNVCLKNKTLSGICECLDISLGELIDKANNYKIGDGKS